MALCRSLCRCADVSRQALKVPSTRPLYLKASNDSVIRQNSPSASTLTFDVPFHFFPFVQAWTHKKKQFIHVHTVELFQEFFHADTIQRRKLIASMDPSLGDRLWLWAYSGVPWPHLMIGAAEVFVELPVSECLTRWWRACVRLLIC